VGARFDGRDAVQFDLATDEIRQLAETSVLAPCARRAMVATDRAIFGLFRMYGTLFELHVDGSAVGGVHDVRRSHRVGHVLTSTRWRPWTRLDTCPASDVAGDG
jgi:hypothetical protein